MGRGRNLQPWGAGCGERWRAGSEFSVLWAEHNCCKWWGWAKTLGLEKLIFTFALQPRAQPIRHTQERLSIALVFQKVCARQHTGATTCPKGPCHYYFKRSMPGSRSRFPKLASANQAVSLDSGLGKGPLSYTPNHSCMSSAYVAVNMQS